MDETQDSQELAKQMLELMPKFSRLMAAHMTALTENETTMMQMGALHMLMHHEMTTSDLAKKRNVSLQAASAFVQGLVERGWVVRMEDPKDRRRSILQVTPDGEEQAQILRQQMTAHLSNLLSSLSQDERDAAQVFFDGLERIVQEFNFDEGKC